MLGCHVFNSVYRWQIVDDEGEMSGKNLFQLELYLFFILVFDAAKFQDAILNIYLVYFHIGGSRYDPAQVDGNDRMSRIG